MSRLSRSVLLAFAAAVVAGTCLHFVYDLLPCPVTALFAPVSESIWEHSKLIYWPALLAGLLLERREPGLLGQRAASLLLAVSVMLALGWLYHIPLGGRPFWWISPCMSCPWGSPFSCRSSCRGRSGANKRSCSFCWSLLWGR